MMGNILEFETQTINAFEIVVNCLYIYIKAKSLKRERKYENIT